MSFFYVEYLLLLAAMGEKLASMPSPKRKSNHTEKTYKMSLLTNISPQIVPVIALLVPIVGVIAWAAVKITQMILLHETVRQLSSNGQPVPPALLAKITGQNRSPSAD